MHNPYAAPTADEIVPRTTEAFVIRRGEDCLYLENKVELPPGCIHCNSQQTMRLKYKRPSWRFDRSFVMRYHICFKHMLLRLLLHAAESVLALGLAICVLLAIIHWQWYFPLAAVIFLFLKQSLARHQLRVRFDKEKPDAPFIVRGFRGAYLAQFSYYNAD